MSENMSYEKMEQEMNRLFLQEPVSDAFVNALRTRLNHNIDQRLNKRVKPFSLRPVWIALIGLILILGITTLIIGPAKVYAAVSKLLGYIPNVGLVDTSAPIRVLAEPVEQTRDGVTVSVVSATLTADRTHIETLIFGVARDAYPNDENISGCVQFEYLRLPDGTKLERMNDFPAVPPGVNEAVLVIPCIGNTLPGKAPENWQIPLRFVAAPADFTVMPVLENTPTLTVEPAAQSTPEAVDNSVTVDQVIETEQGYILIGKFTPAAKAGEWVQTTGMPAIVDANGVNVPYSIPMDIDPGGGEPQNGGFGWAFEFNAAGVAIPLTITFDGVTISQADPNASTSVTFDTDAAVQPGQEWQPDLAFELAGHTLTLDTVTSDSRSGYSFNFKVDSRVYGVGVQIEGYPANGGGGGGGGGMTDGKFSTSLAFAQLPTGKLKLILSNLTLISDPLTWHGKWSPSTPRTDLTASSELAAGVCANANTINTLASLPKGFSGKALVYEQMPNGDHWGLELYDLDGANRTLVTPSGNWGALSPDGKKAVYSAPGGFETFDIASGSTAAIPGADGYDLHWSNDGTKIAFIGGAAEGVYVFDTTTSQSVQVSAMGYESVIGWSADDTRLYILVMFTGGSAWQVREVNPMTGEFKDMFVIENGSRKALWPALSPNGQWIAYRGRENSSVYLAKIDGSETRLLLDNPSIATSSLVWSQNGWLGVSLMQNDEMEQKIILVDPPSCAIYLVPEIHGTLEGLFIK